MVVVVVAVIDGDEESAGRVATVVAFENKLPRAAAPAGAGRARFCPPKKDDMLCCTFGGLIAVAGPRRGVSQTAQRELAGALINVHAPQAQESRVIGGAVRRLRLKNDC